MEVKTQNREVSYDILDFSDFGLEEDYQYYCQQEITPKFQHHLTHLKFLSGEDLSNSQIVVAPHDLKNLEEKNIDVKIFSSTEITNTFTFSKIKQVIT